MSSIKKIKAEINTCLCTLVKDCGIKIHAVKWHLSTCKDHIINCICHHKVIQLRFRQEH